MELRVRLLFHPEKRKKWAKTFFFGDFRLIFFENEV